MFNYHLESYQTIEIYNMISALPYKIISTGSIIYQLWYWGTTDGS